MVMSRLVAGQLTGHQAADLLGVSERQVRRIKREYEREGPAGLLHGNRGRQPVNRLPDVLREHVVELAKGTYAGFNQQHFTEKLVEVERLQVGRMSVRRILLSAGLASPRPTAQPKHRRRRERMPQPGMLLQADASQHRWLGPEGGYLTLIGGVDDATGTVPWAVFREHEDAAGYMEWLQAVVRTEGRPQAIYVDRHGIFRKTTRREPRSLEEQLAGRQLPTQFGRVLEELDIHAIYALSPQAKGRIERLWRTFQDRLVSELRLAGANTLEDANRVLQTFLLDFNARFAVPPADPSSAYRPLSAGQSLDSIFCFKYERVVAADNTIQFGQQRLQLLPGPDRLSYTQALVEVREHLDGQLQVVFQGQVLASRPAPFEAPRLRAKSGPRPGSHVPRRSLPPSPQLPPSPPPQPPKQAAPWHPPANHPWRNSKLRQYTH